MSPQAAVPQVSAPPAHLPQTVLSLQEDVREAAEQEKGLPDEQAASG
jgi:hypothetical protein